MPFSKTAELPKSVRILSDSKQQQWMAAFNSTHKFAKDDQKAFRAAWSAVGADKLLIDLEFSKYFSWSENSEMGEKMEKTTPIAAEKNSVRMFASFLKYDEKENVAEGYFSTESVDSQGQIVTAKAIGDAVESYMKWANVREMHQPQAAGVAKWIKKDDKGWMIAAKVVDPVAQAKCREGVYKGFSIGGNVKMIEQDDAAKNGKITSLELVEISLVDRPANPECVIHMYKAEGAKPAEEPAAVPAKKVLKLKTEAKEKIVAKMAELKKSYASEGYGICGAANVLMCINDLLGQEAWEQEMGSDESAQIKSLGEAFGSMLEFLQREFAEQMASLGQAAPAGSALPNPGKVDPGPSADQHGSIVTMAAEAETKKGDEAPPAPAAKEEEKPAAETPAPAAAAPAVEAPAATPAPAPAAPAAEAPAADPAKEAAAKLEENLRKANHAMEESAAALAKSTKLNAELTEKVNSLEGRLAKIEAQPEPGGPVIRAAVADKTIAGAPASTESDPTAVLQKMHDAEKDPLVKKMLSEKLAALEIANILGKGPSVLK